MKIIVTGGAGFIGSHLCERLLEDGHQVTCVDNFSTGSELNILECQNFKKFTLIRHDVVKALPKNLKVDAIFHLASPASPNHHSKLSYLAMPMETMLVNTQGTLELLKLAKQNRAKFLLASSSEVYGDPKEHPQNENYNGNVSTTGPRSVYDESKRFAETFTAYFIRKHTLDARIARIFNTYGPRMLKADMRMIITFITQALEGKSITIFGNGKQTRSLCYIDDMVEGLVRLMFSPRTKGQIVNLGATEEHTVLEYARIIKKITYSQSPITFSEDLPEDDPKKRRPDIKKAKQLLDWEAGVNLKDGLSKMIEYCKQNL